MNAPNQRINELRTHMSFDTIIQGGIVITGDGSASFRADVGISAGRITDIADLSDAVPNTAEVIDAAGMIVCPGFIDIHTHSDVTLVDHPGAQSKAYQGVTTEVTGNCGFSPYPSPDGNSGSVREGIGPTLSSTEDWSWTDVSGYSEVVNQNGVSINVAPLVGHSALRIAAGAQNDAPPTPDQLAHMQRSLEIGIEQGAFGMSTGLTLPPSSYATTDELVSLASVMSRFEHAFYATHARVWAGWHVKAVEEAVQIGRSASVPVQFSHIAIVDSRVHGHGEQLVAVIENARGSGDDVTTDMYPYTAASSGMSQMLPGWVQEGGVSAMLARLRDPATRKKAHESTSKGWFGGLPFVFSTMVIATVASEENAGLVGKSLEEIAADRGVDGVEAMLMLIDEEDNEISKIMHNRVEGDIRFFMEYEHAMIGSDGNAIERTGIWESSMPHPRFYGTFPRVLGKYVRDEPLISLETAVHKMTGMPARRLGLSDRGVLREGAVADVVVFDPATVIDLATFEDPHRYPVGIPHVLVNGEPVIKNGKHTGARPGTVLKRGV
ncbi:MAG: D-aminoacylase [Chloroflexi bacterium]|nr:D-aminoacylase [Chloroflexota bacterium]MBT6681848.1 D-aminoacylase [Chloroflexota bacterium]